LNVKTNKLLHLLAVLYQLTTHHILFIDKDSFLYKKRDSYPSPILLPFISWSYTQAKFR